MSKREMATVMVDRLMPCAKNAKWKYDKACHLFAADPDFEKLHAFASGIGLKRSWFQEGGTMPHYDLTESKRREAVARGAVEVDRHTTACVIDKWRHRRQAPLEREALAEGRDHLTVSGTFQSDKYSWCPPGFVPLKLTGPAARDLLAEYARRREAIDAEFPRDLLEALENVPEKPNPDYKPFQVVGEIGSANPGPSP